MTIRTLLLIGLVTAGPSVFAAQPTDNSGLSEPGDTLATSVASIDGSDFRRWPIRTIEDWLALQPGVAVRYPGASSIYVRGMRDYSNQFYFNDVPIANPVNGFLGSSLSPHDIGSLSLSPRPQQQSLGGRIDIAPPSPARRFSGSLEATTDNLTTGYGQNWYNFDLAGPLSENLRIRTGLERRYHADRRPSPVTPTIRTDNSNRLPSNSLDGWSASSSLAWKASPQTSLGAWGVFSRDDYRTYDHILLNFPEHMPRTIDRSIVAGVTVDRAVTDQFSYAVTGSIGDFSRRHGDGLYFDDKSAYPDSVNFRALDEYDLFRAVDTYGFEPVYYAPLKEQSTEMALAAEFRWWLFKSHNIAFRPRVSRVSASLYEGHSDVTTHFSMTISESWRVGPWQFEGSVTGASFTTRDLPPVYYYDGVSPYPSVTQPPTGPWSSSGSSTFRTNIYPAASVTFADGSLRLRAEGGLTGDQSPMQVALARSGDRKGLKPERLWFGDLTAEFRPGRKLTLTVNPYIREYQDLVLGPVSGYTSDFYIAWKTPAPISLVHVPSYRIGGELRAYGVATSARLALSDVFSIEASHGYSRSEGDVVDVPGLIDLPGTFPVHGVTRSEHLQNHDQTHKITAVVDLHTGPGRGPSIGGMRLLQDLSVVATVYAASGFVYHWFDYAQNDWQEVRQPAVYQVDLKVEKTIRTGRLRLVPFLWVRNLLDRKNAAHVYSVTGEPDNTGYLDSHPGQVRSDLYPNFAEQYRLYQNDPGNFAPPRQIYLGLRAEF